MAGGIKEESGGGGDGEALPLGTFPGLDHTTASPVLPGVPLAHGARMLGRHTVLGHSWCDWNTAGTQRLKKSMFGVSPTFFHGGSLTSPPGNLLLTADL